MKRIAISFVVGLMTLILSAGLCAQSSEDLDQVELMKQFIGTWKFDAGNDTVYYWTWTPYGNNGKAYLVQGELKAGGITYFSYQGISGFGNEDRRINAYQISERGTFWRDFGQFEAENKCVMKRFNANHEINYAIAEWTFLAPDKLKYSFKTRRWEEKTWDNAETHELTWERVKK